MAEGYFLVWDGSRFTSPNRVRIDKYGNRYMDFSDGRGTVIVWRRDDLEIDHDSGNCKPRDVSKKPLKVMAEPVFTPGNTGQPQI